MMIDKRKAVFIDYCINCSNHAWCTKHDEGKYHHFFVLIKDEIEREFDNITVYGNTSPQTGKAKSPKLGAFEVIFKDRIIFSKLKTTLWPTTEAVLSRIKAILEGRDLSDFANSDDVAEKPRKNNKPSLKNAPKAKTKLQNNRSFMGPEQEQKSFLREAQRDEHSMIDFNDHSKEETTILPQIKSSPKKRDYTSSKPEGYFRRSSSKQYIKLAYLDADKRIVNVTADNQTDYLQKNFEEKTFSRDPSTSNDNYAPEYGYHSRNQRVSVDHSYQSIKEHIDKGYNPENENYLGKNYGAFMQKGFSHRQNNEGSESIRQSENRKVGGSVPASKRNHQQLYGPEHDVTETTVFSEKSKRTEESEYSTSMRKRDSNEPSLSRHPEDNLNAKILNHQPTSYSAPQDHRSGEVTLNVNRPVTTSHQIGVRGESSHRRDLYKIGFPEEKLSEIKVFKDRVTRKKITMIADENLDSKINIYSTSPEIVCLELHEMVIPKGVIFKIPLKFEYHESKRTEENYLFLFKNDRPWQKIILQASYEPV